MTAPKQKKLRIASAFSGGFGSLNFALKYENIPHEEIFAVEWMKPQRECYELNHGKPTHGFYEDIRGFDGTPFKGIIDLYHLSPVCTEFSMAGNRGGLNTLEGNLMFESIRSIDEVQPRIFTVENVAALTSSNGGEDWKEVLKAFRSLKGYSISWGKMNAKHYGGIQNRHRIFIVGFRADCQMMPFPQRVKRQYKLADFLEDEVDEKYYLSEKMLKNFYRKDEDKSISLSFKPLGRDSEISNCITARYQKCGIGDPYIKEELIQVGNIYTKGHNSLWGRVYDTDGIAPTQNAHGGGAGAKTWLFKVIKSNGKSNIRKLTPRECSRVQGDFEDMYKFDGFSDTKKYELIGNAIEINTMRHLIKRVLDFSKDLEWNEPQKPTFKQSAKVEQLNLFGETA